MNTQVEMRDSPARIRISKASRLVVKICGITRPVYAVIAAEHGADMIGLVFAKSRRQVSVESATQVAQALVALSRRPLLVGVFVNEPLERVIAIAREVGLGAIQLSGDESPEYVAKCMLYYSVMKAVRFPAGAEPQDALNLLEIYARASPPSNQLRFLVDAYQPGEYGGTGRMAEWPLAAELASRHDVMLAGGLDSSNLVDAVAAVSPWGVDVSSGVERSGVKDPRLIREFLAAAKQAFRKDLI